MWRNLIRNILFAFILIGLALIGVKQLNSNDFNNTIYLDLKYRIDRTDSKEYILNYRLLNDGELRQLLL